MMMKEKDTEVEEKEHDEEIDRGYSNRVRHYIWCLDFSNDK